MMKPDLSVNNARSHFIFRHASPRLVSNSVDFKAIDFSTAAGVVAGIRPTAQKVWNLGIRLAPTQSALTQVVQDTVSNDYGDTCVKGVVHKRIVHPAADQHGSCLAEKYLLASGETTTSSMITYGCGKRA